MKKFLSLFVILWVGSLCGWAQLSAIDAFVNDSALRPASVGIYLTDVERGEVIAAANEWQAHIPASTMKLVTSATALRLLGSSFTPCTWVDCVGEVDSSGVLQGDLVVRGGGDPTLGSAYGSRAPTDFIQKIAGELQARGVRAIAGTIRVDNSFFEGYALSPRTMIEDVVWDYGAPCYALNYRDNRLEVQLKAVGGRYEVVELTPAGLWEVSVDLVKGDRENVTVEREGNRWMLSGTIPQKREQYTLYLAVPRPDEMLVQELTQYLSQVGIAVANQAGIPCSQSITTLLRYKGENLGYVVEEMNKHSDNLYAESVLRHLLPADGLHRSAENGLKSIRQYWQGCGVDSLALFQYDGSGLARNNKVSAEYIGQVLSIMAQDSISGEEFVNSLPLVGKEGTVASFMRGHKLPGELRLKTGSMSDVQCYAGYYTTVHHRYAVVVLVNNYVCLRKELRQKIATLLTRILPSD